MRSRRPIAGDNIVNAAEAAAGFSIQGTTTGVADGQIATITIVNSANTVLFTFNPVVSGNAWSVTVPGTDHLVDGSYTIKADVSDEAGNQAPEATRTLTVDETAPTAPGVALTSDTGSSSSDHITNNPALTLTNIESGAKVEYSLDGGTTWSISAPTIAQLVQGSNTVDVRQTDVAGNVSGLTAFTFTLDTVVPTIAITTPIAGDNIVNAAEAAAGFSIQGTTTGIADGQTATIVLVNSANAVVDTYTPIVSGNAWSISVTPTQAQALANGSYTVKADVSDVAGNAASEASQSLTVNKAALSIAITSPIAGDNIVNAAEAAAGFSIQGTTTGVADGQIATITIVNSANTVLFTFNPVVSGNAWSVTVPGTDHLPDGSYTIKADVSDGVGNQAPEATQTLTVDETAPAAPGVALASDTGSSSSDHITNNPALTLTNIESGAKVEYSLDGGTTWSISAPTIAQLVQGSNTVDVRQTDVAGNVSGLTAFTFTLDTVVPAAPGVALASDTGSSGSDHITNNPALTLTNIESGAKVEYSLDGGTTWSISAPTIAQLVQGSNTVDVRQTDVAGNVSGLTAFTFTLDTVVPAAPGVALASDTGSSGSDHITNNPALTLTNIESGAKVEYSLDGGTTWSISAPTIAQLVQGSNTVDVRQTDVAGNVSGLTAFTFTLDTVVPAAPGVALTSDTGSSGSDHITNNPALTLTNIESGAKVEYSLDGGTTWSISAPTIAQLVQGSNTVDVRQTDVAGNVSGLTAFTFTLDTVVPTIAITTPIAGDNIVNAAEAAAGFSIQGTTTGIADGQTATIVLVNSANAVVDTYTPIVSGNAWSISVTQAQAQALANGSYTVKADVSDVAGNAASEASQSADRQ